mmetsp:Transcript_7341/g.18826  ORF Transcript_7341/g.18826 Transcript_7341/m.18826 type:complete len:230 (+) Transcript_7341:246-935(+)
MQPTSGSTHPSCGPNSRKTLSTPPTSLDSGRMPAFRARTCKGRRRTGLRIASSSTCTDRALPTSPPSRCPSWCGSSGATTQRRRLSRTTQRSWLGSMALWWPWFRTDLDSSASQHLKATTNQAPGPATMGCSMCWRPRRGSSGTARTLGPIPTGWLSLANRRVRQTHRSSPCHPPLPASSAARSPSRAGSTLTSSMTLFRTPGRSPAPWGATVLAQVCGSACNGSRRPI